jgi:hypothetical protein
MRTRNPIRCATALFVVVLASSAVNGEAPPRKLVEVWNGSPHDVYTSGLRDSLEQRFQVSSDFQLSTGKRSNTIVVTIPGAVKWKKDGNNTLITYLVTFSDEVGTDLGNASGSCWASDYGDCAGQILTKALMISPARPPR